MSPYAFWARIAIGTSAALVTMLAVPVPAPAPQRVDVIPGAAGGALLGVLLFVALARSRPRLPGTGCVTRAQLCFLLGWAWVEEVLWRRLLLGGLALAAGPVVGVVTATALFALVHPHGRPTQLLTGAVFGGAYIGTGRLSSAVASHAVYNLLVAGTRIREPAVDT